MIERNELSGEMKNAWVVHCDPARSREKFSIKLKNGTLAYEGMSEGDALILTENIADVVNVFAVASIYRKRSNVDGTMIYLDKLVHIEPSVKAEDLDIRFHDEETSVFRIDWSVFETALKKTTGLDYESLPPIEGKTTKEQAYIRDLLQDAVMDDLLGPADGPYEEIIGMSVRDRYLVGKLAPQKTVIEDEDELSGTSGRVDAEEVSKEIDASTNQSLVPSSMGLTFCVEGDVENIELTANWGRYERTESERMNEETGKPYRCWKRIPSGGTIVLSLKEMEIAPRVIDEVSPEVVIQGSVSSPLQKGDRLVTIFLVNGQTKPEQNQDVVWLFQPELIVRVSDKKPVFIKRPIQSQTGFDPERESLEMIYRHQVEFAVGHGVSTHAVTSEEDNERAVEIRTTVIPQYEIPITETPGVDPEDRPVMRKMRDEGLLDMKRLADMERKELVDTLELLTNDYTEWIEAQKKRIGKEIVGYDDVANKTMERCHEILDRLKEGIGVLQSDDKALEAFRFANRAMAFQRVHSLYSLQKRRGERAELGEIDVPANHSWRPFQLAFLLLSVPSLANPLHRDRTMSLDAYSDLLWFPTGGGKTEAYLGIASFTMAIRRLQGDLGGYDSGRGLGVIMRYTLRLLTIQQFQRATTLICAMEVLRRNDIDKWGAEAFTIGLWVGQRVTPNDTEDAHKAIEAIRNGQRPRTSSPAQLTTCPWCGAEIKENRDIEVRRYNSDIGRTFIYCGDRTQRCEFSRAKSRDLGIPVLVVDDEIYRRPPSMLIATVDKFAMMAWRGQVRTLFGRATHECDRHGLLWPGSDCTGNHRVSGRLPRSTVKEIRPIRPPDLIIQDELHLISGPLGTMVGLYETAVEELSAWGIDGTKIKPKIIASTATVRKAAEQVNNVFLRRVAVFPPHGLDVNDNFFSIQRPIERRPGRRYLGLCSPGSARPAVLIRVYVALLTAAQALFERFDQAADPYMTVVGYFNSLRELGGMRRLSEDDVQTRSYRVQMSDVVRPGLSQRSVRNVDELTSRVSNRDIPKKLDQLEVKFKKSWQKGETRAIDIVLATNMLSVGVDVTRLGLMVVNGQPKTTAEYIQATSRIGRFFPGLVCTVLTWARPRDLSHYETFEHYHATFYKHVEAQSVTPFSPRAMDRGLTGIMVSMLRLGDDTLNPNLGAQSLQSTSDSRTNEVKSEIAERAWKAMNREEVKNNAERMIAKRIDLWVTEAVRAGRRLGYEKERGQGDVAPLLKKPSTFLWDEFTVPFSMREVEPGVRLVMDTISFAGSSPGWKVKKVDTNDKGGES